MRVVTSVGVTVRFEEKDARQCVRPYSADSRQQSSVPPVCLPAACCLVVCSRPPVQEQTTDKRGPYLCG